MMPIEAIPGMGEGKIKISGGGSGFNYDIYDIL
jgi:hypothetical protein